MNSLIKKNCFLFIFCLSSFITRTNAQVTLDTTVVWQITTIDGNEFIGYILTETETTLEFSTATIGIINLQKNQIKKQERLLSDQTTGGLLWADNPMTYRYFWGNSGYNLKKGEKVYQNTWVLFNHLDMALSDQFTLGVGVMPLFLFAGSGTPLWVSPKIGIPIKKEKIHLGLGGLLGTVISQDFNANFGFVYGNVTFGNKNKHLSTGLGYGFADGEFANRPTVSIAGMIRLSKRGYLITENYFIDAGFENFAVLSLGGRYVGRKVTIDYGGYYFTNIGDLTIIPWLSLSIPFGQNR